MMKQRLSASQNLSNILFSLGSGIIAFDQCFNDFRTAQKENANQEVFFSFLEKKIRLELKIMRGDRSLDNYGDILMCNYMK